LLHPVLLKSGGSLSAATSRECRWTPRPRKSPSALCPHFLVALVRAQIKEISQITSWGFRVLVERVVVWHWRIQRRDLSTDYADCADFLKDTGREAELPHEWWARRGD